MSVKNDNGDLIAATAPLLRPRLSFSAARKFCHVTSRMMMRRPRISLGQVKRQNHRCCHFRILDEDICRNRSLLVGSADFRVFRFVGRAVSRCPLDLLHPFYSLNIIINVRTSVCTLVIRLGRALLAVSWRAFRVSCKCFVVVVFRD